MAEDNLSGLNKQTLNNARDIQDSMSEIASAASTLSKALKDVDGNTAGIDVNFRGIRNSAKEVAATQAAAERSSTGTAKALKEQGKNLNYVKELNLAIDKLYTSASTATGDTKTNLLNQARNLASARDNAKALAGVYEDIANDSAKLDKSSQVFEGMAEIATKYFGSNFAKPFERAKEAAREQYILNQKLQGVNIKTGKGLDKSAIERLGLTDKLLDKNKKVLTGTAAAQRIQKLGLQSTLKSQSSLAAGFKSMGPVITKALGPLALVKLAADAIKFLVDMFIGANKQAVDLARSMGTSTASADTLRDRFRDIRSLTGTSRNNIQALVDAQKQLNDEFGAAFVASDNTLDSQTFLTKRLMLSSQEAAKLNIRFEAFDKSAKSSTDSIMALSQNFADANGYAVPLDKIMKEVASATGQTAASFGFSNEAIAKGVLQVRKFGLNLTQARSISEGLLNFESSISAELEAELLSGRQLNLEKARMFALTGDIAGATEEVMSQMQDLTEEQRKNPVIMKSMAAAAGLTVDQLQDAYLINENNNKAAEKYERIMKSGSEEDKKRWREQSGLEQATREEIEKRVTLGEQFTESMQDVKQLFVGLVSSGAIETLVIAIQKMANFLGIFMGPDQVTRLEKDIEKAKTSGSASDKALQASQMYLDQAKEEKAYAKKTRTSGMGGYAGIGFAFGAQSVANSKAAEGRKALKMQVEDFKITTHPKDTLVMAGGTKLGGNSEKTEKLLERLISVVEKGGDVFIDGNKVGESLVLASHKFK